MFELIAPILEYAAGILVVFLIGLAANYVRKRWNLDISARTQEQVENWAREAVHLVSQRIQGSEEDSQMRKKDMAVNHLVRQATGAGVKLAAHGAGDKVEAAVNKIKRERHAFSFLRGG